MTDRRPFLFAFAAPALALSLVACQPAAEAPAPTATAAADAPFDLGLPADADAAAGAIVADDLKAIVAELSSDAMAGRAPGSDGDRAARAAIIARLQALGLEPGAAGAWEQEVSIVGVTAKPPKSWDFASGSATVGLAYWDDYIASAGVQADLAKVENAEVVFVGYGIEAPEYGWDDFKGQDLSGKVLLMLNNDPDWDDALFAGERRLYYGRWTYKYESAARHGAAAAIIVHTDDSAGYPWQVVQSSWSGEQFALPAGDEPRVQVAAWATWDASSRLAQAAGQDLAALVEKAKSRDFAPVSLGLTTSLSLPATVRGGATTANVAGLVRGSDPALAEEVVIYTAHHDHLGVGEPDASGDAIYNGARDNASGVAQVLEIAKAFKALETPPRRSILFLLVAAEEQGLLGSAYYSRHPTVAPGKIAACINLDSGNIWGKSKNMVYVGYGKSSLDRVAEAAAAKQDRVIVGDQFPSRGFFYRSDQFSLARIGVPALYLDGGTDLRDRPDGRELIEKWEDEHYHQPSDELADDWRYDGMIEDAQLGFWAGLSIAQADAMPTWNPGDEFEAARQQALAAARPTP